MTRGIVHDEWRQYAIAARQTRRLEKQQQKEASNSQNWDWDQYRVSPTCPPTTSIFVRGGWCWEPASWGGYAWDFLSQAFDLGDTDVTYTDYTFTNAYWYTACTVGLDSYGSPYGLSGASLMLYGADPDGTLGGGLEEFETATEAEESLDAVLDDAIVHRTCLPLCQLILRNNGNIVDANQYLPIDRLNRGRSYIYGGDLRTIYRI